MLCSYDREDELISFHRYIDRHAQYRRGQHRATIVLLAALFFSAVVVAAEGFYGI